MPVSVLVLFMVSSKMSFTYAHEELLFVRNQYEIINQTPHIIILINLFWQSICLTMEKLIKYSTSLYYMVSHCCVCQGTRLMSRSCHNHVAAHGHWTLGSPDRNQDCFSTLKQTSHKIVSVFTVVLNEFTIKSQLFSRLDRTLKYLFW